MNGEINRDFYCSGFHIVNNGKVDYCVVRGGEIDFARCKNCTSCHRKCPTPEQYKEEYGEEWNGAVYALVSIGKETRWGLGFYSKDNHSVRNDYEIVVCACTPWGKPPADWRPECVAAEVKEQGKLVFCPQCGKDLTAEAFWKA